MSEKRNFFRRNILKLLIICAVVCIAVIVILLLRSDKAREAAAIQERFTSISVSNVADIKIYDAIDGYASLSDEERSEFIGYITDANLPEDIETSYVGASHGKTLIRFWVTFTDGTVLKFMQIDRYFVVSDEVKTEIKFAVRDDSITKIQKLHNALSEEYFA